MISLAAMLLCMLGLGCLFVSGVHWLHGLRGDSNSRKANIEASKWMLAMSAGCVFAAVTISSIWGV